MRLGAHTAPRPEAEGDWSPGVNEHWTQGRWREDAAGGPHSPEVCSQGWPESWLKSGSKDPASGSPGG